MQAEIFIEYLVYAIVCLLGSITQEYMRIMKSNPTCPLLRELQWPRIFLSTFTSFILVYSFSGYLARTFWVECIALAAYTLGILGFEITEKMATISKFRSLAGIGIEFLTMISSKGKIDNREGRGSRRSTKPKKVNTEDAEGGG